MAAKLLTLIVDPFCGWLRVRAERRALLAATDGLSHSPEELLSDIGISRDKITALYARKPMP
jgi:uncharacterized protein YjiS (DUF1127 family)